jgi:hypothetical protein
MADVLVARCALRVWRFESGPIVYKWHSWIGLVTLVGTQGVQTGLTYSQVLELTDSDVTFV